ncbi:MAG: pyruvate formate-lyase-activating protein [Breznakia sp.]
MARIHSFESFGTVDGPGVRFVVFLQGCPLRCLYCHNPDSWKVYAGDEYSVDDVFQEIMKYKNYIRNGGVTLSGGEPLLQIEFAIALFKKLKKEGLHTCVDTSGITFQQDNVAVVKQFEELLKVTDLFLLDVKHIDLQKHQKLTGASNQNPQAFAHFLDTHQKPMWIRYVLVPGISDEEKDIVKLKTYLDSFSNITRVEVLPYHTMGISKYEQMNMKYPLSDVQSPTKDELEKVKTLLGVKQYEVNK